MTTLDYHNLGKGIVGLVICVVLGIASLFGKLNNSDRPTCPKSGGEPCPCIACECPDGCPGVCQKPCCEVGK